MKDTYNRQFVTDEFLTRYFPSCECFSSSINPKKAALESSKKEYVDIKKYMNNKRQTSGKKPFSDSDIVNFIKSIDGIVKLKEI